MTPAGVLYLFVLMILCYAVAAFALKHAASSYRTRRERHAFEGVPPAERGR